MPISCFRGAHRVIRFKRPPELNELASRLRKAFPDIRLEPVEVIEPKMSITHHAPEGRFVQDPDRREFPDGTHMIARHPSETPDNVIRVEGTRMLITKTFYLKNRETINALLKGLPFTHAH